MRNESFIARANSHDLGDRTRITYSPPTEDIRWRGTKTTSPKPSQPWPGKRRLQRPNQQPNPSPMPSPTRLQVRHRNREDKDKDKPFRVRRLHLFRPEMIRSAPLRLDRGRSRRLSRARRPNRHPLFPHLRRPQTHPDRPAPVRPRRHHPPIHQPSTPAHPPRRTIGRSRLSNPRPPLERLHPDVPQFRALPLKTQPPRKAFATRSPSPVHRDRSHRSHIRTQHRPTHPPNRLQSLASSHPQRPSVRAHHAPSTLPPPSHLGPRTIIRPTRHHRFPEHGSVRLRIRWPSAS